MTESMAVSCVLPAYYCELPWCQATKALNIHYSMIAIFLMRALTTIGLLLSCSVASVAQSTTPTCTAWFAEADSHDRPAVIFGAKYSVPAMRIRLLDGVSGQPLDPKAITLNFSWEWLEYPYSEHAWGAWSEAADRLECALDSDGWLEVPPHEVEPRGWYDGKYTRWPWPRRPHFTGVGIVAITRRGLFARPRIDVRDLLKFRRADLVIAVFDGWRTETRWQPKTSPR
jgi:hypothetical protein